MFPPAPFLLIFGYRNRSAFESCTNIFPQSHTIVERNHLALMECCPLGIITSILDEKSSREERERTSSWVHEPRTSLDRSPGYSIRYQLRLHVRMICGISGRLSAQTVVSFDILALVSFGISALVIFGNGRTCSFLMVFFDFRLQ